MRQLPKDLYVFLGAVVLETLSLSVCLSIAVATSYDSHHMPQYLLSLLMAVALVAFAVHGCVTRNKYELAAFLATSLLCTAWAIVKYAQSEDRPRAYLAAMVIAAAFQALYLAIAQPVARELDFAAYHLVGGDKGRGIQYENWLRFAALAKVDAVYAMFLVLLAGFSLLKTSNWETYVDAAMVVVTIGWSALGYWAVRAEHAGAMPAFYAFAVAEPIYIVVKLVQLSTVDDSEYSVKVETWVFILLGIGAIAVRIAFLAVTVLCQRHFGTGLKAWIEETINRRSSKTSLLQKKIDEARAQPQV